DAPPCPCHWHWVPAVAPPDVNPMAVKASWPMAAQGVWATCDAFSDRRADGECSLYTAVDNSTVFATDYTAAPANARQACQLASQTAAAVIQHLGGD
ncbi:MAG TPA: hypothetical protein VGL46_11260, partial [Pseudonocardiaceae bacterium]